MGWMRIHSWPMSLVMTTALGWPLWCLDKCLYSVIHCLQCFEHFTINSEFLQADPQFWPGYGVKGLWEFDQTTVQLAFLYFGVLRQCANYEKLSWAALVFPEPRLAMSSHICHYLLPDVQLSQVGWRHMIYQILEQVSRLYKFWY